jgi:hypothetical protein
MKIFSLRNPIGGLAVKAPNTMSIGRALAVAWGFVAPALLHAQVRIVESTNVSDTEGIIPKLQVALNWYFLVLGLSFVGAIGWAGWKVWQEKDVAPLKWVLIGGTIFALAGALGRMLIGWMS